MYTLGLKRSFTARHFLIGGDFGEENHLHSHDYTLEAVLERENLNRYGFVADITLVEQILDKFTGQLHGAVLNEIPELEGLNPSIEHLARFAAQRLSLDLHSEDPAAISATLWEDDQAWAGYRLVLQLT